MPYSGDDYLKLLDLTGEGRPQKYNEMMKDYYRLYSERYPLTGYRGMSKAEATGKLAEIRKKLVQSLGILPHETATPVEMHSVGKFGRDGYTVEKIWFESMPGRPVTGLI